MKLAMYHCDGLMNKKSDLRGIRPVLVVVNGTKYLHAVLMDFPIRLIRIHKQNEKYLRYVDDEDKRALAVYRFRQAAKTHGITKGAAARLFTAQF